MKYWWILGILALILFVWTLRERFTTYTDALKDVGQTAGYTSLEPKCPEGSALNAGKTMCTFSDTKKTDVVPTCSTATLEFVGGVCRPKTTTTHMGTSSGSTPVLPLDTATTTGGTTGGTVGETNTTVSTTSGTTTGGSSDSSLGPNSGGGGNRRKQVFGPLSGGRATRSGNVVPSDSSKTSQYPEIMGGSDDKPSTRIDGGGIVAPSKNWQLTMDGSLPSDVSLGNTENSKYLPYSRQPGDMDLIPDPYRVSQQFSAASYSFKTEPSPFLTDFSAFLK